MPMALCRVHNLSGNVYGESPYSTMFLDDDNRWLLQKGWKTVTDPITGKEIIFKDTDVDKYNANNPAFSQDYNVNMSGGNDRGTYYAGIGYNHQEGVPISTFMSVYLSLRMQVIRLRIG